MINEQRWGKLKHGLGIGCVLASAYFAICILAGWALHPSLTLTQLVFAYADEFVMMGLCTLVVFLTFEE